MSDQDPFATTADGGDPFAAPAPAAAEIAATPPESTDPSDPSIPVVDREGLPVASEPVEAPVSPSAGPVDPAVTPAAAPPADAPEQQPVEEAAPAPEEAPQTPEEAQPQPEAATAPPEAEAAPANAGTAVEAQGTGPRGGKGELRKYKIAYQTGPTSWEFHPLDTVPEGVEVVVEDGERWVKARNNDHALRLGYVILGAPTDGITVWPVPMGAFKPKPVKPAPPKPERTRLVIG